MMSSTPKPAVPWSSVPLLEDTLFDRLLILKNDPGHGLSAGSITSYIGCLRRIRKQFGGAPTIKIICMAKAAIAQLEANATAHGISANTLKADLNAVMAVAKHVMSERQREHTQGYVEQWQAAHKRVQEAAMRAFECNKASLKQQAGFTPYAELCAVRDVLPQSHMLRLWLALSTMIPCARAGDYANCKVFKDDPTADDLHEHGDNYCVLSARHQYIHLRVFKTSRCYPLGIKLALPECLCAEIAWSLKAQPRDYLFVQGNNSTPYELRASFTNRIDEELKYALRNPDATAQLVRRAYVTAAHAQLRQALQSDDAEKAALAKEKLALLAHCCGHSVSTQRKYVFDLDDGGRPELLDVAAAAPIRPLVAAQPVFFKMEGV